MSGGAALRGLTDAEWASIIDRLHYSGTRTSERSFGELYAMCDGFGALGWGVWAEVGYDWSHVRDSSNEALRRVADRITELEAE
jgi:hypothetical protein